MKDKYLAMLLYLVRNRERYVVTVSLNHPSTASATE